MPLFAHFCLHLDHFEAPIDSVLLWHPGLKRQAPSIHANETFARIQSHVSRLFWRGLPSNLWISYLTSLLFISSEPFETTYVGSTLYVYADCGVVRVYSRLVRPVQLGSVVCAYVQHTTNLVAGCGLSYAG